MQTAINIERTSFSRGEMHAVFFARDGERIDFGLAPIVEPFLDTVRRVAAKVDIRLPGSAAPGRIREGIAHVRSLGVASVLGDAEPASEGFALLFHLADALAYANVIVAWQSLCDAPSRAAGLAVDRCAFGSESSDGEARSVFSLFSPFAEGEGHSVVALSTGAAASKSPSVAGLLGFPDGELRSYTSPRAADRPAAQHFEWAPAQRQRLVRGELSLLAGLIAGATRRLVDEAYTYAQNRQSGGRAIAQHQAVALRLADLALHQRGLWLYLAGHAESCEVLQLCGTLESICEHHVADLAFRVARDAVQVAGGHGYVEGLPFRRLFEQVRTLTSALALVKQCPSAHTAEALT